MGFLFQVALAALPSLVLMGCATSSVIKMPQATPAIVKDYRFVKLSASQLAMLDTGGQGKGCPLGLVK